MIRKLTRQTGTSNSTLKKGLYLQGGIRVIQWPYNDSALKLYGNYKSTKASVQTNTAQQALRRRRQPRRPW